MKIKTLFSFFVLLTLFFCLVACVSKLPGENQVILSNLSAEYFNIAENYLAQKKYSKAIENYNLCLRTAENQNQIKFQLAKAYCLNKEYAYAQEIFEALLQEDSDNLLLLQGLAYCYAQQENSSKAVELYATLYAQNPHLEDVANNYFLLLINAKDFDKATEVLEKYKIDFAESANITKLEEKLKIATEDEIVDD